MLMTLLWAGFLGVNKKGKADAELQRLFDDVVRLPHLLKDYLSVDFSRTTPTQHLLDVAPLWQAQYSIEASTPTAQEAQLLGIAPRGLEHVFFSDSGSTAVEVAIKMAVGAWHNRGHPRRGSSRSSTPITATCSARCQSASGLFNATYERCCSTYRIRFPRGVGTTRSEALERLLKSQPNHLLIVRPARAARAGCACRRRSLPTLRALPPPRCSHRR
jgi:hypothetical protein